MDMSGDIKADSAFQIASGPAAADGDPAVSFAPRTGSTMPAQRPGPIPLWGAPAGSSTVPASEILPPRRVALFGLPAETADAVGLLAELLGWEVATFPAGPAASPPARLCLAMLPPSSPDETSPMVAWSPNTNLNEHISCAGLSIMDQPLCIAIMETMLLSLSIDP